MSRPSNPPTKEDAKRAARSRNAPLRKFVWIDLMCFPRASLIEGFPECTVARLADSTILYAVVYPRKVINTLRQWVPEKKPTRTSASQRNSLRAAQKRHRSPQDRRSRQPADDAHARSLKNFLATKTLCDRVAHMPYLQQIHLGRRWPLAPHGKTLARCVAFATFFFLPRQLIHSLSTQLV